VTPTLEVVPLRPHVRVSSVDSSWMEGSSFSETRYSTDTIEGDDNIQRFSMEQLSTVLPVPPPHRSDFSGGSPVRAQA